MEKRFCLLTTILTWILILAGGLVHSTGSGLACPDWPLCYGSFFPEMKGGILFEHSHRLIAGSVAILTLLTMILVWKKHPERSLRMLSLSAFLLVIFQAILGGLTVIFQLPTLVSSAHLATSMIFFSIMATLSYKLFNPSPNFESENSPSPMFLKYRKVIGATVFVLFIQIVLGAVIRHTGAGSVCPDFPLCQGSLWPSHASTAVQHHMAHRWGALIVSILLIISFFGGLKIAKNLASKTIGKCIQIHSLLILPLLVFQIFLGIFSVLSHLDLVIVTSHLGVGALLFINTVCLWHLVKRVIPNKALKEGLTKPTLFQDLLSLSKARLSALVLIVTTISYFLAQVPRENLILHFFYTIFGTLLLVTGASFLNAYFERDIDAQMKRTADRPLPSGRMSGKWILFSGILLAFIGVPLLTFMVNPLTGFLGALAFLFYSLIYTPLKAQTPIAALIGALPGAMPPLLGWTAATGSLDLIGLTLFFILFFWQLPHFWAIALYRKDEYLKAGIKVMPVVTGDTFTKKQMIRYCAMLIPFTLFLVPLGVAGKFYFFVALLLGLTFLIWTCYGQRKIAGHAWARSLFLYSIIYLPLLFITLLFDSRF